MKTLAELQAIRDKARAQIGIREEDKVNGNVVTEFTIGANS